MNVMKHGCFMVSKEAKVKGRNAKPLSSSIDFNWMYKAMRKRFGFLDWWPGETTDEIVIGAILTQQTNWKNVEKAIANLKANGLLSIKAIANADPYILERMVRPSGYYRQKAARLRNFSQYVVGNHGSLRRMLSQDAQSLRKELLGINGIGKETADSIILYASEKPVFVIDAYTIRIVDRVFGIEYKYDKLQAAIENSIERDVKLYKDFHAQFVELGKRYCKKEPVCSSCPLSAKCLYSRHLLSSFDEAQVTIKNYN